MIALIFIAILALLILAHEFGHFIVAKISGIAVEEFAFGFPPRLISKKYKDTLYSINLIPLGGYVKLLGEESESGDHRSFSKKPVWKRFSVVIAGVIMNILLAAILFSIGFKIGMSPITLDPSTLGGVQKPYIIITNVLDNTAASKAKLKAGDKIESITINGENFSIQTPEQVQELTALYKGKNIILNLSQDGKNIQKNITLGEGEIPLGVGLARSAIVKLSISESIKVAFTETFNIIGAIGKFMGNLFVNLFGKGVIPPDVAGPVGIYTLTAEASRLGLSFVLQLTALLSINLAVLNILPIPALDGGRAVFIILEGIFRKKIIRQNVETIIHTIGFILLLVLLLAITVRDIIRLN